MQLSLFIVLVELSDGRVGRVSGSGQRVSGQTGQVFFRVKRVTGQTDFGSDGSRVKWVSGQMGLGSNGSRVIGLWPRVIRVSGQMGFGSGYSGFGSNGFRVELFDFRVKWVLGFGLSEFKFRVIRIMAN